MIVLLQHVKIACYKGRTSFEVINELHLHVLLQKSEDQLSDMSIDVKQCYNKPNYKCFIPFIIFFSYTSGIISVESTSWISRGQGWRITVEK